LAEIAAKVVESNPQVVADYKAGKEAAMQFLVGQGMKESRGAANPAQLREEIKKDNLVKPLALGYPMSILIGMDELGNLG
jgi:Asp-tRNA(Asn)/Glu-tRNA(Gln) amidotransferase B subunit